MKTNAISFSQFRLGSGLLLVSVIAICMAVLKAFLPLGLLLTVLVGCSLAITFSRHRYRIEQFGQPPIRIVVYDFFRTMVVLSVGLCAFLSACVTGAGVAILWGSVRIGMLIAVTLRRCYPMVFQFFRRMLMVVPRLYTYAPRLFDFLQFAMRSLTTRLAALALRLFEKLRPRAVIA